MRTPPSRARALFAALLLAPPLAAPVARAEDGLAAASASPSSPPSGAIPLQGLLAGSSDRVPGQTDDGSSAPSGPTLSAIVPPLASQDPLLPPVAARAPVAGFDQALVSGLRGPTLAPAARAWTVTPSVGLGEEYTTDVLGSTGGGGDLGADAVTLLLPGLAVAGDTARLQGSVTYDPSVDLYARHGALDRVDQDFSADVLAALVPGTFFVEARGFGTVTGNGLGGRPAGQGSGPLASQGSTVSEATQSVDLALDPYLLHRFGPIGTGELGVGIERLMEDGIGASRGTLPPDVSPFDQAGDQDATTLDAHAALTTGEAFGRYNAAATATASHTSGTGVLSDATQDRIALDNGYALTRNLVALLRVGAEHIHYAGTMPLTVDDGIWSAGFRIVLGPESTVEVRYGHHDGFDAATLDAALRTSARTRLYARYSEGLNTQSELLSNALADTDLDQLGDPIDHANGAPLLLADGFFGAEQNLYRTKLGSVSASLTEDRDIVTVGVQVEDNILVSYAGFGNFLGSNSGAYGTLDWSHQWTPTLTLSADGQYGERRSDANAFGPASLDHVTFVSLALAKQLTETLSAQLRYRYDDISSRTDQASYTENVVLLTVQKSF